MNKVARSELVIWLLAFVLIVAFGMNLPDIMDGLRDRGYPLIVQGLAMFPLLVPMCIIGVAPTGNVAVSKGVFWMLTTFVLLVFWTQVVLLAVTKVWPIVFGSLACVATLLLMVLSLTTFGDQHE